MVELRIKSADRDGSPVLLRLTGKRVGGDLGTDIYLTDAGRVVVVFEEDWLEFDSAEDFTEWVSEPNRGHQSGDAEAALAETAGALGAPRIVDL